MYSSMKCGVMKLLNNCLESFINCVNLLCNIKKSQVYFTKVVYRIRFNKYAI